MVAAIANEGPNESFRLDGLQCWHKILCNDLQKQEAQRKALSDHFITLHAQAEMVAAKCVGADFQHFQSSRASLKMIIADLLASSDHVLDATLVENMFRSYCEATEQFHTAKDELWQMVDATVDTMNLIIEAAGHHGSNLPLIAEPGGETAIVTASDFSAVDEAQICVVAEVDVCLQVARLMKNNGHCLDEKLLTTLRQVLARTDHFHQEFATRCHMIQSHAVQVALLCGDIFAIWQLTDSSPSLPLPLEYSKYVQETILFALDDSEDARKNVTDITAMLYDEITSMRSCLG